MTLDFAISLQVLLPLESGPSRRLTLRLGDPTAARCSTSFAVQDFVSCHCPQETQSLKGGCHATVAHARHRAQVRDQGRFPVCSTPHQVPCSTGSDSSRVHCFPTSVFPKFVRWVASRRLSRLIHTTGNISNLKLLEPWPSSIPSIPSSDSGFVLGRSLFQTSSLCSPQGLGVRRGPFLSIPPHVTCFHIQVA